MSIEQEIRLLGERMGVQGLAFTPSGLVAFDVENLGRVFLEAAGEDLLLYLARPIASHDAPRMAKRVLELCHFSKGHPLSIHGGVYADAAVLLCQLPAEQVTAATMENTVAYLAKLIRDKVID